MRTSRYFIQTTKEVPADAEIVSHQLMLRAGLIRKLAAGLYSWLPLGMRVLQKVEKIVREEMNRTGAMEVLLPVVQPAELWQETGRWDKYGPMLLKIEDRNARKFCFGPTHEEVITDLARRDIRSYKQLPMTLYQIQVKFRDEIRPRFGVMRAREFIMKDAYSFHLDKNSLTETYHAMYEAYGRIFTRLGLEFRAVLADSGDIGGNMSHEFQVLAHSGEDVIAYSDESQYAANIELAEAPTLTPPDFSAQMPEISREIIHTPKQKTIAELARFTQLPASCLIKTLLVKSAHPETPLIALALRGDHELNIIKAQKLPNVLNPLTMATEEEILKHLGCEAGSIGPLDLPQNIPLWIDRSAAVLGDFCCGTNQTDQHYLHAFWPENLGEDQVADLRFITEGDPAPDGQGKIKFARGIEVGHIFQLDSKYSSALNAVVATENGENLPLLMGCYGIGVSRIVAAAIEQNHDERGICWPAAMAPFQLVIIPVNAQKSPEVKELSEKLYDQLSAAGIEVLLDDRAQRPGVMFAEMELIGIAHRIVVGERNLANGQVEYQGRRDTQGQLINLDHLLAFLQNILG